MVISNPAHSEKPTVSARSIHKSFGSNEVLKGIDIDLYPGEVLALVGGNGAGKSTLMKILMGIYQADSGRLFVDGVETKINKPSIALANGIYLVPQEPMLFPNMSVEENIIIGFNENKAELRNRLKDTIQTLGWELDLKRKALTLSIAEQQLVEILRGLMRKSKLLIFDEPTSSLTFNEVEALFTMINLLRQQGLSIIYITHRLNEVFQIADRVVIMSDGLITLNAPVEEVNHEILVRGLLPTNIEYQENKICSIDINRECKPIFEVNQLTGYGFSNISFKVYLGEILGIAGIVGAGRTELVTSIFGKDDIINGKVILDGEDITGLSTHEVMSKGLSYVPEDRFLNGMFRISSVAENTTASSVDSLGHIALNKKREKEITNYFIDTFRTRVTGCEQEMGSLSGGNQQKVVIGRSIATKPKLLILDEPTRGIDAAARADVYAIINKLRQDGMAILIISSDMEEIVELSDRVLTMYSGQIVAEFNREDVNHDSLMAAAFGIVGGKV
jgi:AI-2 transport system ATP-binding protein